MNAEDVKRFFFQAEDGIRDYDVTGVQTCALPISQNRGGAGGEAVQLPQFESVVVEVSEDGASALGAQVEGQQLSGHITL